MRVDNLVGGMLVALAALTVTSTAGCTREDPGHAEECLMSISVEFRGRHYTDSGSRKKVKVGRRLGLGVMATCDGKGESVPVFKVVGQPVARTIFIKSPPIGVLVPEDPNLR
jgi:hypothetical protein